MDVLSRDAGLGKPDVGHLQLGSFEPFLISSKLE